MSWLRDSHTVNNFTIRIDCSKTNDDIIVLVWYSFENFN